MSPITPNAIALALPALFCKPRVGFPDCNNRVTPKQLETALRDIGINQTSEGRKLTARLTPSAFRHDVEVLALVYGISISDACRLALIESIRSEALHQIVVNQKCTTVKDCKSSSRWLGSQFGEATEILDEMKMTGRSKGMDLTRNTQFAVDDFIRKNINLLVSAYGPGGYRGGL